MSLLRNPLTLTLAAALTLAAGGCGGGHDEPAGTAAPAVRAASAPVERLTAAGAIELQGTVAAERTASVSARVMAMVTALHVAAGDAVSRGQLLLEIDPQVARGQLAQARGALGQATAALALAERNLERFEALAATNAASELELDLARMQHDQARSAVEQAEGAVAAASAVAADSRVTAPFAGRVARTLVEVGDLAAPGRPLVSIESATGRRLRLRVPESLMARSRLASGDRLRARIDARPELGDLEAVVVEVAPGADPVSHTFEVELELDGADLASGLAGRAWLPGESRELVAAPRDAVLRRGGMSLVVLVTDDGLAESRAVTLGEELAEGRVEVLSGLAGGETVLVGLAAVPPAGARVEPVAGQGAGS